MSVLNLSPAQLLEAVKQIQSSTGFASANPHLTPHEMERLQRSPPQWPASPVFSPFATTHDGYSQVRYKGTKYIIHRLTYQQHWGDLDLSMDISHTLYLGDRTTRLETSPTRARKSHPTKPTYTSNINPNHLMQETNEVNQSRKLCFLFMEAKLWEYWVGMVPPHWGELELRQQMMTQMRAICGTVHHQRCCDFDLLCWGQKA
jgi:hypothetical protein